MLTTPAIVHATSIMRFPMTLKISNPHDGQEKALAEMPCIGRGHCLEVLVDPSRFVLPDTRPREWVLYIVMYDRARPEEPLYVETNFFKRESQAKTTMRVATRVVAPDVSVFLAPLEDYDLEYILNTGGGTMNAFSNVQGLRDHLSTVIDALTTFQNAPPVDFKSDLGLAFVNGLGIDPNKSVPEILADLVGLKAQLGQTGGLTRLLKDAARNLAVGGLIPLFPHIGDVVIPALKIFQMLERMQHSHEFRLYELKATLEPNPGDVVMEVTPTDVPSIRLDQNNEGKAPGGATLDLRHVFCWHHRPLVRDARAIGLVKSDDDNVTPFLQSAGDGLKSTPNISVDSRGADTFAFNPSVTLALTEFQGWRVDQAYSMAKGVSVVLRPDGVLEITGLNSVKSLGYKTYNTRIEVPYGFGTLKSPFFDIKL